MPIPHCPNPECEHFRAPKRRNWYIFNGHHNTAAFGIVQRYRCKSCGRTFSDQTFSIDYYAKKIVEYEEIIKHLVTASGNLDMSRFLKVRSETVQNRIERLARVALAIHSDLLKELPLTENLVADGFETFSYSQYFPCHINAYAGSVSEFIYCLGFANLRRKGRMTEEQKLKREELEAKGKAASRAIQKSFRCLTADMTQRVSGKGFTDKRILFTDEHYSYKYAIKEVKDFEDCFLHRTISSKAPRTLANPLMPVNYWDRQQRKDLSDHTRETLQNAKCPSAMMARSVVYRHYFNLRNPRRVKLSRRGDMRTHAEMAGISKERLEEIVGQHWGRRPFLHKLDLNQEELNTWLCLWTNPGFENHRRIPKYINA